MGDPPGFSGERDGRFRRVGGVQGEAGFAKPNSMSLRPPCVDWHFSRPGHAGLRERPNRGTRRAFATNFLRIINKKNFAPEALALTPCKCQKADLNAFPEAFSQERSSHKFTWRR